VQISVGKYYYEIHEIRHDSSALMKARTRRCGNYGELAIIVTDIKREADCITEQFLLIHIEYRLF